MLIRDEIGNVAACDIRFLPIPTLERESELDLDISNA